MKGKDDGIASAFGQLIAGAVFGPNLNHTYRLILQVSRLAAGVLSADAGSVWLLRERTLHRAVIINRPVGLVDGVELNINEGLVGQVIRTGKPVTSNNLQNDPRIGKPEYMEDNSLRCYIGAPVMIGSACLGVMGLYRKNEQPFSEENVKTLLSLTGLLGLAIHHCSISPGSFTHWDQYFESLFSLPFHNHVPPGHRGHRPIWVLEGSLPKGIQQVTLARVYQYVSDVSTSVTCSLVSKAISISYASARRYLSYLHKTGAIDMDIQYSNIGRPSYSYSVGNAGNARSAREG